MAQTTPTKEQLEWTGSLLGILVVAFAIIRWPLWWTFQKLVAKAMRHELTELTRVALVADAGTDAIEAIRKIQDLQGVAIREVPKMSGLIEEMTRTLSGLNETVANLNQNMLTHGTELGRVTGFIDGVERRRAGRRKDDPPLPHDP